MVQSSLGFAEALKAELVFCAAGYLVCCCDCCDCVCWNVWFSVVRCMLAAECIEMIRILVGVLMLLGLVLMLVDK